MLQVYTLESLILLRTELKETILHRNWIHEYIGENYR